MSEPQEDRSVVNLETPFDGLGKNSLLNYIQESVIGDRYPIPTPFGLRPLVYADYTASGRVLSFLEDYIRRVIHPTYSNTHTSTSFVGLQTSFFRKEAREIIGKCLNASEEDVVLFCGSGCTAAVDKLVGLMKSTDWGHKTCFFQEKHGSFYCKLCSMTFLTQGSFLNHMKTEVHQANLIRRGENPNKEFLKPVVFLSVFEHHSNLLPWREAGAIVVQVPEDHQGLLDMEFLEKELERYKHHPYKVGAFSAASNITGILCDVKRLTSLLHSYNALAFFDYAAAGPYIKIDMNPEDGEPIDALYLSVHKFPGGPGSPGVLAIKRNLLGNDVPIVPGGGTVIYVTEKDHTYMLDPEEKEEGGTPDIVGSIRAGLVFQLKNSVGEKTIEEKEYRISQLVMQRLTSNPNIIVLGNGDAERLPIFSFMVRCGRRFFHHSFICALINDLFGVECRGGCACAGPYAFSLLSIPYELAKELQNAINEGYELFKPGFVRINFNYFASEESINYILDSIEFVANNALWFLPQYQYDMDRGAFMHWSFSSKEARKRITKSLGQISYGSGKMEYPKYNEERIPELTTYLTKAQELLQTIKQSAYEGFQSEDSLATILPEFEHLRWFVLPAEALNYIKGRNQYFMETFSPFYPKNYCAKQENIPLPVNKPVHKNSLTCFNPKVPKSIIKKVLNAVNEFDMIQENDRILVCMNGGNESMTMLHVLKQFQQIFPGRFTLAGASVGLREAQSVFLKDYLSALQIPFYSENYPVEHGNHLDDFGKQIEKGLLISCARREDYNVIAMGENLDDFAESFIVSTFHSGVIKTLKAHFSNTKGDIRIVRPLAFVRERAIHEFCSEAELTQESLKEDNCSEDKQRAKVLLAAQERVVPNLFSNLMKSMKPLMHQEDFACFKRQREIDEHDGFY